MEIKKTEKIDVTKYVGTKTKIAKAEYQNTKYGESIFLQTDEIKLKEGDKLPKESKLTGSIFLSLFKDSEGNVFVGEDTKTETFLKAKKIQIEKLPDYADGLQIKEMIGISVIVQKNAKGFLEIA